MLLQAYVTKVETIDLPLLEQRLAESSTHLGFLVDYVTLSPADMNLNRATAQWHTLMPSVFQDHRQIVAEKAEQYQADLKVSAGARLMCFICLSVYLSVCMPFCLSVSLCLADAHALLSVNSTDVNV